MNAPRKIIGTAGTHPAPRTLVGKCVPNADRQFPGKHPQVLAKSPDPTGGAGSPANASISSTPPAPCNRPTDRKAASGAEEAGSRSAVDPAPHPSNGYGTKPRCQTCGRGQAGCICNMPDPEPEYFKPGLNRDPDWYRVEM